MPAVMWSFVTPISDIQIQQNGQTMVIQVPCLPQVSSPMTIIIDHLNGQTLCYVQLGMFEFI